MKSVVRSIISFIWVIYFGILFVFAAGSFLVNPDLTIAHRFKAFITQSGSMVPTINVGDVIIDDISLKRDPHSGDIITFKDAQGHTVTHRVIGVTADGNRVLYTTKGDNNEDADPDKITKENVIAFYKARIPFLGYLVVYLRKPAGLLLLILLPIILTASGELVKDDKTDAKSPQSTNKQSVPDGSTSQASTSQVIEKTTLTQSTQASPSQTTDAIEPKQTQQPEPIDLPVKTNPAKPRKIDLLSQAETEPTVSQKSGKLKVMVEDL